MLSPKSAQLILSPQELQMLEQLRLLPRRRFSGRMRGERMSRQKGISLEFADYREYSIGDDLRHLDWNILARLGRPTIRTYQDEDDLAVYLLLDNSRSMDFGVPTKFAFAKKLAVALGFIGLRGQDQVIPLQTSGPPAAPIIGRNGLGKLNHWAETNEINQEGLFLETVGRFIGNRSGRPGVAICITDGLDRDISSAIRSVGARGHEIIFIHLLSNADFEPEIEGDLRLIDSETGPTVDITAEADVIRQYQQNLARHSQSIETAVGSAGGRYLLVESTVSALEHVVRELRQLGVIG